jgi:RimJ/RimL family protein N-acetyltransferase
LAERSQILAPAGDLELRDYFSAHPDETIWLRVACAQGGARAAVHREGGRVVAVAVHDASGVIHVHAAVPSADPPAALCVPPGAVLIALAGAPDPVEAARAALGLGARAVLRDAREVIMSLDLAELETPPLLEREDVVVRRARPEDLPLLDAWLSEFAREVHAVQPDAALLEEIRAHQAAGRLWVLEDGGAIVNTVSFSAVFPEIVQVEYSYSPRELRSKQYGRSACAGALLAARAEGVRRAVFNTQETNRATQAATEAIGFRIVARYRVLIFGAAQS